MAESWVYAIVLIVLVGLNVAQFLFFTHQLQTLVDKIMSRDFGEYTRTKSPQPRSTSPRIEAELFEDKPPEGLMF